MKIVTTVLKTVSEEVNLQCPAFFKKDREVIGFYSPELVIKVTTHGDRFTIILKCEFNSMLNPGEFFEGEKITAEDFNNMLENALDQISKDVALAPLMQAV